MNMFFMKTKVNRIKINYKNEDILDFKIITISKRI